MDKLFKALNDPTRRAILERLREQELSAGEIAAGFTFSKPTISHHLDLLKQSGLILAEKRGQFIIYSLNTTVLEEGFAWLLKMTQKRKETAHETAQPVETGVAPTPHLGRAVLRRRPAVG